MARESDALDGEELLGIGGLVEVDEAGFDLRDGVDIFVADGGESGRVEGIAGVVGWLVVGGFADHDFVYCSTMRGRRGWDGDRMGVGNKGNIGERFLNWVGGEWRGPAPAEFLEDCDAARTGEQSAVGAESSWPRKWLSALGRITSFVSICVTASISQ